MNISLRALEDIEKKFSNAKTRLANVQKSAQKIVGTVVQTTEVAGTAFGFGVVNGRWGSPEILGMPVDLAFGAGMHLLAFLDVAEEHAHNIGDGALASYTASLGAGIGRKMLVESNIKQPPQGLQPQP
jgi:hypothetical protein